MDESRFFEFEIQDHRSRRFACVAPSLAAARQTARGFGIQRMLLRHERATTDRECDERSARAALDDPLLGGDWITMLVDLVETLEQLVAAPAMVASLLPHATMPAAEMVVRGRTPCAMHEHGPLPDDPDARLQVHPQLAVAVEAADDGGWWLDLEFDLDAPGTVRRMGLARALGWQTAPEPCCDRHAQRALTAREPAGTSAYAVAHRLLIALRFVGDLRAHDDLSSVLVAPSHPYAER